MSSAFALFASVLPASAGTPAAARDGQDGETADLFSATLADVFQDSNQTEAVKVETPHHALGRLSLQTMAATDLNVVEAETSISIGVVAGTEAEVSVAPDKPDFIPSSEEAKPVETGIETADKTLDAANAQQPIIPQVIVPVAVQAPVQAPPAEVASTECAGLAPTPAVQADLPELPELPEQKTPVSDRASILTADGTEAAAELTKAVQSPSPQSVRAPDQETTPDASAPTMASIEAKSTLRPATTDPVTAQAAPQTPDSAPAPQLIATDVVAAPTSTLPPKPPEQAATKSDRAVIAGSASPDASSLAASAADASPAPAPEKPAAKPVSNAAKTEVLEAPRLIDPSSPKSEIKVSVQPAIAVAQSVMPVQTTAIVSNLAVAEAVQAVEAVETQAEAPRQAEPHISVPLTKTAQSSQAALAKAETTPPMPSEPLRSAPDKDAPTEGTRPAQDGSELLATDHVAMADAASGLNQTRQAALGQAAPANNSATPVAAATLIDPAASSLDPTTPVEMPPEARASEGATITAQATASSLSRATIETTAHLAAQIARKLEGRSTRFDMVLTPEDLGRVDVSLEIGADGQLAARLAFDNPAAAAELRGRADELRRQLQDAGFQVTGDSLDFTQRDTSSGGGFDRQHQQRQALFAGAAHLTAQADVAVTPPPGAWTNHSQTRDRVDVRV